MVATLIVNADDFGLTEGTNQAILDGHQRGIITSTSLLANGYAFEHAIRLAKQTPALGVGVHLTLTEGPPVTANPLDLFGIPDQKSGRIGHLPLSNQPFARALLRGKLPTAAIHAEFSAQVEKIMAADITPTHIDGHKYIHLLPGITAIAANVARQYQIPVMRVPHRIPDPLTKANRLPGLIILGMMATLAYRVAHRAGLRTVDRMVGFIQTGHLTKTIVRQLLAQPRPGYTEMLCHPGYRTPALSDLAKQGYEWIHTYDFDSETQAVSDPDLRQELPMRGWQLVNFGAMSQGHHN